MKSYMDPNPVIVILTVVLATTVCFPAIWCQETQPYAVCNQKDQCGDIEFDYPFWGLNRPRYCGHSGFQITCQSNVPVLLSESVNYRVLYADMSTRTMTIARNDLWSNLCPQNLYNTTYNSTVLNGDNFGQQNVSIYYRCNTSVPVLDLVDLYQFNCNINGSQSTNYFGKTRSIDTRVLNSIVQCNNHIIVPVNQSSDERLESLSTEEDLRSALTGGFNLEWTAINNLCDPCIRSDGRCGSASTSPDLFACYCANGNFSLTCNDTVQSGESQTESKGVTTMVKLLIGFSSSFVGIVLICLLSMKLNRKKKLQETQSALQVDRIFQRLGGGQHGPNRNHQIELFIQNYKSLAVKRFQYSEIKKMTKSFQEKLGQGGYGSVYKGKLPDGHLVAVKLLNEATGGGEDFINEVASIGRTSHINIATLLGFCYQGKKKALVYEFMSNGSLDRFLRDDDSHLDWNTLFQIAKGIARGLEYLHRGCNTRIVHFDIKPQNVLLDEEFVPKISDFGLAKLCKKKESIVSVMGARGTAGYMAPEVFFKSLGGASHKSDVYSYGMMVLEMTGARKNNNPNTTSASKAYFPEWIFKKVEAGKNLRVDGVTTDQEDELARKMVTVSLWCIQYDPSDRPPISKVVEMLEGKFESLQIPPRRFWESPTRPARGTSPLATQSSTSESILTVQAVGEALSS